MIRPLVYIDTSTALAHLLNEDVVPPERIWRESLVSSRLLEYEAWRRLHTMGVAESSLRRYESAMTHLREAVATYRSLGRKDAELCIILESLADCQESMSLPQDARESLTEALAVAKELQLAYQVSHLEARLRVTLH